MFTIILRLAVLVDRHSKAAQVLRAAATEREEILPGLFATAVESAGHRARSIRSHICNLLVRGFAVACVHVELPDPGLVILDSPLVTYREPWEHIGEGVKIAFCRTLATAVGDAQVAFLENDGPPQDLKDTIAYTAFTKNRDIGRYGLVPPLPPNGLHRKIAVATRGSADGPALQRRPGYCCGTCDRNAMSSSAVKMPVIASPSISRWLSKQPCNAASVRCRPHERLSSHPSVSDLFGLTSRSGSLGS